MERAFLRKTQMLRFALKEINRYLESKTGIDSLLGTISGTVN